MNNKCRVCGMDTKFHGSTCTSGGSYPTPNECGVLYSSEVDSVRRRMQVLNGIWAGKGVKEIGADLGISPKTVEWHRQNLYRLFGVSDQISLCKRAIKRGLLRL